MGKEWKELNLPAEGRRQGFSGYVVVRGIVRREGREEERLVVEDCNWLDPMAQE